MSRVKDKGELGFAGLLLALGIYILVGAFGIEVPRAASNVGPRFFPIAVGILLTASAAVVGINILRGDHAEPEESELVDPQLPTNWRRVVLLVATVIGYGLLLDFLGFVVATSLAFFCVAVILGSHRYVRLAVGAVLLAVLVYVAFTEGLGISLPPGILQFLEGGR